MPIADFQSHFPVSPETLFAWHARPGALERLVPPWLDARIIERTGSFADMRVVISMPLAGPLRKRWVAQHFDCDPPTRFRDRQEAGPFAHWVHTHDFLPDDHGCLLRDSIDFAMPLGALGSAMNGVVRRKLDAMFRFRHRRTREDLARHLPYFDRGPQKVAISGGSGMLGSLIRPFLTTAGHDVRMLVRRRANAAAGEIQWDPAAGTIDAEAMEGLDAVIHLSGRNIADGRWTEARKADYVRSRVESTNLIARTLTKLRKPPRVLVAANATGIYGNTGDAVVTEESPLGDGFVPDLCVKWETASFAAREAGIRVVNPRIGIVLSQRDGALKKMLPPFRMGIAGRIGTGSQYMNWISTDDLLGVMLRCLFDETLSGPVNATAPNPVTNRDFTSTLARVLGRPALLPFPAPAVRLIFGEMGQALLLDGARVVPAKLQEAGFEFFHPSLDEALRWELGR